MELKDLIASGEPFADDQAALNWCLEPVSVRGRVSRNTLIKWAANTNAIARLEGYKTDADTSIQSLAYAALEVIRHSVDGMDLSDADAQGQLSAMVSKGMFTQAEIDSLNAYGTTTPPRWQAQGVNRAPTLHEVKVARGTL